MQAMEISRSALDVEWRRLEVIAQNLAIANMAQSPGAEPWQVRHLVSGPKAGFAAYLDPGTVANGAAPAGTGGVRVYGIETSAAPPRLVHEPGNPLADENGFVAYPAIDHAAQMTLMMRTARAYEASIVAMNTARQMYSKGLELGRRS